MEFNFSWMKRKHLYVNTNGIINTWDFSFQMLVSLINDDYNCKIVTKNELIFNKQHAIILKDATIVQVVTEMTNLQF